MRTFVALLVFIFNVVTIQSFCLPFSSSRSCPFATSKRQKEREFRNENVQRLQPPFLSFGLTSLMMSGYESTAPAACPTCGEPTLNQSCDKRPMKIIIAGAPASGKGTQCEVIKAQYGVVHLSTGDILRAAVKAGTELGLKAKSFMDGGKLVPDELIIGVVSERLSERDCREKGWLLDGFPRTKAQADALKAAGHVPDCFILLDVPEDVLVERVTGRRTDPVTGKIYHMKFSPPESEEVRARLVQRSDDTAEKIIVRFREFQSHITAIRSSYEDRLISVDGTRRAGEVSHAVVKGITDVNLANRRGISKEQLSELISCLIELDSQISDKADISKFPEDFQRKISPLLKPFK